MVTEKDITIEELIKQIKEYNPNANIELIKKAYEFSRGAHLGQKRASGDDFIIHPLHVAEILAGLRADSATIAASLLHDVLEDTKTPVDQVKKEFGEEVASLVEGVTKIKGIRFETKEYYKAENLRKVLLATTKDVRVMLIKLADRLHNMKTLKDFREEKQKRIAEETMKIYAPIAEKLGMWSIKGEIEDLSMRYLNPEAYFKLKEKIAQKRTVREKVTEEITEGLRNVLKENNIEAYATGRAKYFYSIYQKMLEEGKEFDQILDLIGIRVVVSTVPECYRALALVHKIWSPMEGRFKDYIAQPKQNGYQSLHTTVTYHDKILEVQIRTKEMHLLAEEGVAAHWKYKGTERDKQFDKKISWLKQLLLWKRTAKNAEEYIEDFKIDMFKNEIIVLTPKGDPIVLPEGATTVDFAFEVHTNIGMQCSKAKVNGEIQPLDYKLKSGDIVYIITSNSAKPSRQWLKFVVTSKARSKIKQALGIEPDKSRGVKKEEEEALGENLVNFIEALDSKAQIKISKCCAPELDDLIVGYLTKEGKITIHKKGCPNIHALGVEKEVRVRWKKKPEEKVKNVTVIAKDSVSLLSDLLYVISSEKANVLSIYTKAGKYMHITLRMGIEKEGEIEKLIPKLKAIKGFVDIKIED